jgi:hypothetical protein
MGALALPSLSRSRPGRFLGCGRPGGGSARRRSRAAYSPTFFGGALIHRFSAPRTALLTAAGHLIDRRPGAPLRFILRNATLLIPLFNMLGLPFLFFRIFGFFSPRHGFLPSYFYTNRTLKNYYKQVPFHISYLFYVANTTRSAERNVLPQCTYVNLSNT